MATHTQLEGVSRVGDSLLSDQLEANLSQFFQWGLLGAGGFFNVTVPTSGCYGGDEHRLRPVNHPGYQRGQVWEAFRKDWVWETGVECPDGQPVRVSGVYIDGHFRPLASGVHVDYPNGRVVLDSPAAGAAVTCEYSPRLFQIYTADCPWWQQVQLNSFRVDDGQFLQAGSGAWDTLAQSRVQLPAVIVEAVPRTDRRPFQIGDLSAIVRQDVLFHVLAEERWHFKWMHDALTYQWQKRIQSFDKNRMFAADAFPLLPDGSPRDSGMMYPDLVRPTGEGGFLWRQIRFDNFRSQDQRRIGSLHYCTVRATVEVDA